MCSLRPDEDRLVLSCVMEIDARGEVVGYRGVRGDHPQRAADDVHAGAGDPAMATCSRRVREQFAELVPEFERMHELALKLNAKRQRRGSIDFDLPEPVMSSIPRGT